MILNNLIEDNIIRIKPYISIIL